MWSGGESEATKFSVVAKSAGGKGSSKLAYGYYKFSNQSKITRFAYVPESLLYNPNFSFDDVFGALGIYTPNLVFEVNGSHELERWNVRLPTYKTTLIGADKESGAMIHYKGVIRENCRRLLKGTAMACEQAGAVFRCRGCFMDKEPNNIVCNWLNESSVPILGLLGSDDLQPQIKENLMSVLQNWTSMRDEDEDEDERHVLNIDFEPWKNGTLKHKINPENKRVYDTVPMPGLTHLILSDNIQLLESKLEKTIPTGLIVIHGGSHTTRMFCEAVQDGKPIFLFKYTGSTADLACEMLQKVEAFLAKKRTNPHARPEMPFRSNIPVDSYSHPRWLTPFGPHEIDICRQLNILIENFPDRYNPASILQIDMFDTSEEKLQDQLTKTMSVVFEGIVELGGASAESRRLTYAWRFRHLLRFNASRQRFYSDILEFLVILFTLLAVLSSVVYVFTSTNDVCIDDSEDDSEIAGGSSSDECAISSTTRTVLLKLNLILPLLATVFRGIAASLNPLAKWLVLKTSAFRVESEIYMYRTKVGKYNPRKMSNDNNNSNARGNQQNRSLNPKSKETNNPEETAGSRTSQNNPRKTFSNALDSVWTDLTASDISKGSLISPPEDANPLEGINVRLEWTKNRKGLLNPSLGSREVTKKGGLFNQPSMSLGKSRFSSNRSDVDSFEMTHTGHMSDNPLQHDAIEENWDEDDEKSEVRSVHSYKSGTTNTNHTNFFSGLIGSTEDREQEDENYDDGVSSLTADEYVKVRLIPMITALTHKTPTLSLLTTTITCIVTMLSVCSSVFASFNLTVFIPLALAFGGALTSWRSYRQADLKLAQINGALNQLNQLVIWWDSLSMIEKRVPANKEFLVSTTEQTVQIQVIGHMHSRSRDEENDDAEK